MQREAILSVIPQVWILKSRVTRCFCGNQDTVMPNLYSFWFWLVAVRCISIHPFTSAHICVEAILPLTFIMATEHALRSNWKNGFLSNIVGHLSRETPEALYREYPISSLSYEEGYRRITYHDFANAINGAARWLSETLGLSKNHEVLTYIGPNDLRYTVLVLAAVKAGYVLFLTSPRKRVIDMLHQSM